MISNLLSSISEKFVSQKNTIEDKVKKLESQSVSLHKALDLEFDKQTEAELDGKNFDDSKIKKINSELMNADGLLSAYKRQLLNLKVSSQDDKAILKEAASEYKRIVLQNLEHTIRQYELDIQIRKLMDEGRSVYRNDDSYIYSQLKSSGLFKDRDVEAEVKALADILNDPEYIRLDEKIKECQTKHNGLLGFIWSIPT